MMAFVEPPIAMCTRIALSKAAGVRSFCGTRSSHTMSTIRRPDAAHMRGCAASAAGTEAARDAAFELGPVVLADAAGAFFVPVFPGIGTRTEFDTAPVAAQLWPCRHVDRRQSHADGAHDQRRRGLVAAAHEHSTVDRMAAQELLRLHRQ